jgi:hypothetical protein
MLPGPIAQKYCEGKMKRTLKRELKEHEIADKEAYRCYVSSDYYATCMWYI